MSYNLTQYKYPAVIQFQNDTSQFEIYFGGKIEQAEAGNKIANNIVSFKVLQCQYMIGNTIRTQGLLGEWYDNAGNLWSFASGSLTITSPSGGTRTITNTTPTSDGVGYAMMLVRYYNNESDGFSIAYGIRIPQDTTSSTFLRSPDDIDTITEYVTDYFESNVNSIDTKKYAYMPFYNTFTDNDYPIECIGCLWTDTTLNTFEVGLGGSRQIINATTLQGFVNPSEDNPNNPYDGGGTTSTGGGGGTFDPSGDIVDVPSLPLLSALDTGFVTMWRPTKTELSNLYNYLWSSAFDLESFKKIFANPMDTFLGFGIIPLNPTISGPSELKVGNIGTGINLSRIGNQYYEIDCGSVDIPEFFGSYLDYEPYSTLDLFLPYIGSIPISIDDVRTNPPKQGSIKVIYHIDILSGSCVAFIRCKNKKGQWTTCYQYNGSVFTPLPITGNDFASLYQGVLSAVSSAVGLATNIGSKNFGGAVGNVANIASSVVNSKPTINRSGSMGSSGGRLGSQVPYLIMNLPKQAVAFAQNTFTGYPSHITNSVRSLSGYTEFEQIWVENVPATENELSEIESILTSGVIL